MKRFQLPSILAISCTLTAALLFGPSLRAQTWTGGGVSISNNDEWSDDFNWSSGQPPTGGGNVVFGPGVYYQPSPGAPYPSYTEDDYSVSLSSISFNPGAPSYPPAMMEEGITVSTVVGIDVGGTRKGFHAVALDNGCYLDQKKTDDACELVSWCVNVIGARVIAVDAPCRWSADGRARPAERELMQKGIYCFSSTTRAKALVHRTDNFGWMLRGEELYQALEATHPLCLVLPCPSERYSFETFPHAVTWYLRGGNASAKRKRIERPELLRAAGIQLPVPSGIDTIDAALCALTAHLVATGAQCLCFGDAQTGYIVVPKAEIL